MHDNYIYLVYCTFICNKQVFTSDLSYTEYFTGDPFQYKNICKIAQHTGSEIFLKTRKRSGHAFRTHKVQFLLDAFVVNI